MFDVLFRMFTSHVITMFLVFSHPLTVYILLLYTLHFVRLLLIIVSNSAVRSVLDDIPIQEQQQGQQASEKISKADKHAKQAE